MMKKLRPISLATLALLSGLASSAMADERRTYIVMLADEPVATYNGGVNGLPATAAAPGTRLQFQTRSVQAYVNYLDGKQQSVMALVGNAPIVARYTTVLNGFAARLTDAEVLALRANPQVLDIQADMARKLDTISTSKFLGLSAPGGLWSQMVGGKANKGEDIVIGIVDGGIWPENPAFADKIDANGKPTHDPSGTSVFGAPVGWAGACMVGSGFTTAHCNNKLIGARFFNAGFKSVTSNVLHWTDFADSPRDSVAGSEGHGGHGDHTASTAGGNSGNPVLKDGVLLGEASGMAPRARLASYKVCWTRVDPTATDGTGSRNSCFDSDSVAAIDSAVRDGVHVINYSISGSLTSVNDAVEQAFLRAAKAGVFVAASAGNSGPANQVAHVSPWITTVAAAAHDRFFQGTVTLGDGSSFTGASLNTVALPAAPLISAVDAKAATASDSDANLCFLTSGGQPALDPAKVAGKIVVCTRGTNDRVQKSLAVANAGGVGMIMQDTGSTLAGLVADKHSVPSVHVTSGDGTAIRAYMTATAGGTAALSSFVLGSKPAPITASFSSRGPNLFDSNVLKPDLTAPGVDVIAAVSANLSKAEKDQVVAGTLVPPYDFESYQGTSMSSPHVAGLAALLKQAHPSWSPAAIKSALMTTGINTLDDGRTGQQNGVLPWSQGAGHVNPNGATDPGLVYDTGPNDWTKYQCKVNRAAVSPVSDCSSVGTLDETYNLNLASITAGAVPGAVTVTRRVTNVGTAAATYTATASVPNFTTVVTPASLTLNPGETKSFAVALTAATGAAENVWQFGSLTWSDGTHMVKSPISVRRGKAITTVDALSATSASGSRLITVRTGFAGKMTANKGGLKEATMSPEVSLAPTADGSTALKTACQAGTDKTNIKVYTFTVPVGAIVAKFGLRNEDAGGATNDNDLGVLSPDGNTWNYSGNDGSNESVQLVNPVAGTYKVCVVAFAGAAAMTHSLSSWIVSPTDMGGKLSVMLPAQVFSGGSGTVGFSWSGLEAGKRYLGGAQFKDAGGAIQATTILSVSPNAVPQAEPARAPSARELSKLD